MKGSEMKRFFLACVAGGFLMTANLAHAFLKGGETIEQIIEALKANRASIHNGILKVHTVGGTFAGKLIQSGSNSIVLEMDSQRSVIDGNQSKKIATQQVIFKSTIVAVEFDTVR
jgi:hypothetical protein